VGTDKIPPTRGLFPFGRIVNGLAPLPNRALFSLKLKETGDGISGLCLQLQFQNAGNNSIRFGNATAFEGPPFTLMLKERVPLTR
jgi:hypothetical protein